MKRRELQCWAAEYLFVAMRNWRVEVCGSGGVTLWSAIVRAPNERLAKAKALELMQRGGGWRPRLLSAS